MTKCISKTPNCRGKLCLTRRRFIKQLGIQSILLSPFATMATQVFAAPASRFMYGINAYYLLVEAYRHVHRNKGKNRRALVYEYLVDKLCLPALRDRCGVDSIRYWAFNDYPDLEGLAIPGTDDARLWKDKDHINPEAFEVLAMIIQVLDELDFMQVPVLANYWPSYGGILQYLVWAGELDENEYLAALCNQKEEERLYLQNTMSFYTSRRVRQIFRQHVRHVISLLTDKHSVKIVEIMNEPRGKNPLSLQNKPIGDKMSSDIVADWLNEQGLWIRNLFKKRKDPPGVSSGEEGWIEKPVTEDVFQALNASGQYFEGIDLIKNISSPINGITIASIHVYLHPAVSITRKSVCGSPFVDRRGWPHLARDGRAHDKPFFERLTDEWIMSRAKRLKDRPWYIGEMGWCWPGQEKIAYGPGRKAMLRQRHRLYRHWIELARQNNAKGVFVWMLNGLEHRDHFYGMGPKELQIVLAQRTT